MLKFITSLKNNFPQYHFLAGNAEALPLKKRFDFVIISDTVGLFPDVQKAFEQLQHVTDEPSCRGACVEGFRRAHEVFPPPPEVVHHRHEVAGV